MHPDHRVFQEVAQLRFPQRQRLLRLLNLARFLFEGLCLLLQDDRAAPPLVLAHRVEALARDYVIVRGTNPADRDPVRVAREKVQRPPTRKMKAARLRQFVPELFHPQRGFRLPLFPQHGNHLAVRRNGVGVL